MKNVTEFWNVTLFKGLQAKEALAAEGKTPEEIQASLGETFKYEGDKLKHFTNALEVANQNKDKLHRVLVVTYAEGEAVPPKALKVEEHHYLPAFIKEAAPVEKKDEKAAAGRGGKGGKPNRGGGGGAGGERKGPKTSPWGLTPEEIAAKKGGGKNKKA